MKLNVKCFIWWSFISCISVSSASLRIPEDQLARVKRSRTSICVEVRPASLREEPYYMCRGGNIPVMQTTKLRSVSRPIFPNSKFSPTNKLRYKSSFDGPQFNADRIVSSPAYGRQSQLQQQPFYSTLAQPQSYRPQLHNDFNLQRTKQQSSLAFPDSERKQWQFARRPVQTVQTQSLLQQQAQPEPEEFTLGNHAEYAPSFAQREKPFQTFQAKFRSQPSSNERDFGYQHQQRAENEASEIDSVRYYEEEETPNNYNSRQNNGYSEGSSYTDVPNYRSNGYGEPSQRSYYTPAYRIDTTPQYDSADVKEQYSTAFPTTLDQLVPMDGSTHKPFTGVTRPISAEKKFGINAPPLISDQDLLLGNIKKSPISSASLTNEFTEQQTNSPEDIFVDVSQQDLQTLYNPSEIPSDYMNDPVLRTFYSTLGDPSFYPTNTQSASKKNELLGQMINKLIENNQESAPAQTQQAQDAKVKSSCTSCANSQEHKSKDANDENYSSEKVSRFSQQDASHSRGSCPGHDFNWPPVVIAMPCCGQQSSAPPPPLPPTGGYYNPYAMPVYGMFPGFMSPLNSADSDNTNYSKLDLQNKFPSENSQAQHNLMINQGRSATNDNNVIDDTTVRTTTSSPDIFEDETDSTVPPPKLEERWEENTTNIPETIDDRSVTETHEASMNSETDDSSPSVLEEPTTNPAPELAEEVAATAVTDANTTTDVSDTLKPKDEPPKTFQAMLNRAKTFKEMAETGLNLDTLNNEGKKGKRQNFKDANAALRTIAQAVAASNKRKYSTMLR